MTLFRFSQVWPFNFIDPEGEVHPIIGKLITLSGYTFDGTLDEAVKVTQKQWLRGHGKERWQIEARYTHLIPVLQPYYEQMQLHSDILPTRTHYSYALIFGANVPAVRKRLSFLKKMWLSGITFDTLVLLGSQRPLDPTLENKQHLLNANNPYLPFDPDWKYEGILPKSETEMFEFIFAQADFPSELKQLPLHLVDTPMIQTANGQKKRPTTGDTIVLWCTTFSPSVDYCMIVSDQPYIDYQRAVALTDLDHPQETVGYGMTWSQFICNHGAMAADLLFDTWARCLYQERLLYHKKIKSKELVQ